MDDILYKHATCCMGSDVGVGLVSRCLILHTNFLFGDSAKRDLNNNYGHLETI